MKHCRAGILVALLGLSVATVVRGEHSALVEQYKTLLKECQVAPEVLTLPPNSEERKTAAARLEKLPLRFWELAEANPKDPIAVDALIQVVWMTNNTAFPATGQETPSGRAMALLVGNHIQSDKLGPVCLRLVNGFRKDYETFLRTVLEMSPHQEVRGMACLALAEFLNNRSRRLALLNDQPDLTKRYTNAFGAEYLGELQQGDRTETRVEVTALLDRAVEKYGAVTIPSGGDWVHHPGAASLLKERPLLSGGTVGKRAEAGLFENHLPVGTAAPNTAGEDQDGMKFKLSDYRGKVVLLDFWGRF